MAGQAASRVCPVQGPCIREVVKVPRTHNTYASSHFSITHNLFPRSFMTRSEMYYRALAMTNRLHELQELHHWSAEEASVAFKLIDEPLPIGLHMAGLSVSILGATCALTPPLAFEPVIRPQGSAELKQKYVELIAQRGILGQVPIPRAYVVSMIALTV